MNEIINEGAGHRTHIKSPLMRESLMDRKVLAATDDQPVLPIIPDVHVVHLGGASILDRGKAALLPLLDEVVRCRKTHKIILGVGGGRECGIPFTLPSTSASQPAAWRW